MIIIKFKDLSLKFKLYLCLTILIIIPLILMQIYLNYRFIDLAVEKSSETALNSLKLTGYSFYSVLEETNNISIRILSQDLIQSYLKGEHDKINGYTRVNWNVKLWFDTVIGTSNIYNSISLYSNEGRLIYQTGSSKTDLDQSIIAYAYNLQGQGFWITKPGEIFFYRAIMDLDKLGMPIGIERFDIDEDSLYQLYKKLNSIAGSNIYLVDSSGLVISSTERDLVGVSIGERDYIKKAKDLKEGFFTTILGTKRYVTLCYSIINPDWMVVQIIPESVVASIGTSINVIIIAAILLCILFGLIFSLVQNKYWITPLKRLQKEMLKVKNGNFSVKLNIDSKDEIGDIGNSFINMARKLDDMINDVYLMTIKQKEAELKALESQINPHFLYNTLDSIHWQAVRQKNYDISDQIASLAEMFKHILNKGDSDVTICQEIQFLDNYMLIQQQKYGDRIKLQIEADPELMNVKVPKLIIQPLVENAIVHGLDHVLGGGVINVRVKKTDQTLFIIVSDNGIGTDETRIRQMMNSKTEVMNVFALKNIDDRLKIRYGNEFGLIFVSKIGNGTRVEIHIPILSNSRVM